MKQSIAWKPWENKKKIKGVRRGGGGSGNAKLNPQDIALR